LKETWRIGKEVLTIDNYTFFGSGPDVQHGRGSCGVGILLSPTATVACKASGPNNLHNDLGPRVIALRMLVLDPTTGKHIGTFMISTYAPTFDASETDHPDFEDSLSSAISRPKPGDILIICADVNANLGRCEHKGNDDDVYTVVGPHGLDFINSYGRRLRSFLELHYLT